MPKTSHAGGGGGLADNVLAKVKVKYSRKKMGVGGVGG